MIRIVIADEAANCCFVELQFAEAGLGGMAGLGKAE